MNLLDLTASDLQRLQRLLKRRQRFQSAVDKTNREILAFVSPGGAGPKPGRRRRAKTAGPRAQRGRRGGRRGQVKEQMISALQAAGKGGISVKDLAQKVGTKYANASVWLHSTGKKLKAVRKVRPGVYAWRG